MRNAAAQVARLKRLRGAILELLRDNHDRQWSHLDATALWSALLRGLRFDVSKNEVKTLLQDLGDRGYVRYIQQKDNDTGEVFLVQIELTAKGRDLLEETITDPAVEL
jgi:hypothetical protein